MKVPIFVQLTIITIRKKMQILFENFDFFTIIQHLKFKKNKILGKLGNANDSFFDFETYNIQKIAKMVIFLDLFH